MKACLTIVGFIVFLALPQIALAVSDDVHQRCLKAVDYEGCINSNDASEDCNHVGGIWMCLTGMGERDAFGLMKPPGYYERVKKYSVTYFRPDIFRIPHKGQDYRYFGIERIRRGYFTDMTVYNEGYIDIYDCEDNTMAVYYNVPEGTYWGGRLKTGWKKSPDTITSAVLKEKACAFPENPIFVVINWKM